MHSHVTQQKKKEFPVRTPLVEAKYVEHGLVIRYANVLYRMRTKRYCICIAHAFSEAMYVSEKEESIPDGYLAGNQRTTRANIRQSWRYLDDCFRLWRTTLCLAKSQHPWVYFSEIHFYRSDLEHKTSYVNAFDIVYHIMFSVWKRSRHVHEIGQNNFELVFYWFPCLYTTDMHLLVEGSLPWW